MQKTAILPQNPSLPLTGTTRRLCRSCQTEYLEPGQYICECDAEFCPYCDAIWSVEGCSHLLAIYDYWGIYSDGGPGFVELPEAIHIPTLEEILASPTLSRTFADEVQQVKKGIGSVVETDLRWAVLLTFLNHLSLEYCYLEHTTTYGLDGLFYVPNRAAAVSSLNIWNEQLTSANNATGDQ